MLKSFVILKTVISFIISYIILYAIYIQLNGEASPGGGFQAGVIFASGIIGFDLIGGGRHPRPGDRHPEFISVSQRAEEMELLPHEIPLCVRDDIKPLIICGVLGVLLYASTGLISFFSDDNYLNYDSIFSGNHLMGQHIGIFFIELGVGLTVASIMCLIYLSLRDD